LSSPEQTETERKVEETRKRRKAIAQTAAQKRAGKQTEKPAEPSGEQTEGT
jgi:hypothetical protein